MHICTGDVGWNKSDENVYITHYITASIMNKLLTQRYTPM